MEGEAEGMTLENIKNMRVDIHKVFERNQELFKLLDWYLAQNIFFREKIKRLRKRLNSSPGGKT